MARDFEIDAEGIGKFWFRRRTYQDAISIEAEMVRILGGVSTSPGLIFEARKMAELKVLCVSSPDGWDLAELDPFEDETTDRLHVVWEAFRKAETTFRERRKQERAAVRA